LSTLKYKLFCCNIIFRNKDVNTLDETYWEKSFTFHTVLKDANDSTQVPGSTEAVDKKGQGYDTKDWAPKFLQPILQEVVLTGKSMEMLEGLGKLAEENDGPNSVDQLKGEVKGFKRLFNQIKEECDLAKQVKSYF